MKRVLISVEGLTEETFVREILTNHLSRYNIFPIAVILSTKNVKQGNVFKGGILSYSHIKKEVLRLLRDSDALAVTTMYDLYGLPHDFPGYSTKPVDNCYSKVEHLENEFQNDVGSKKFVPYFQLHEFEAMLFVDPKATSGLFPENDQSKKLIKIKENFNSPEEINDGVNTAPSKRILKIYSNYEKPLYGSLVAIEVGLEKIRSECNHFNKWLEWLESLGSL